MPTAGTRVFLDDESADLAGTSAFLDRRIDDVMRFEKAKARWKGGVKIVSAPSAITKT